MRRVILSLCLLPLLGGCVASAVVSTAAAVVTAPIKIAGKAVDAVTTSQSEADENRGRKARKEEARQAKHDKKLAKERAEIEKEQKKREREAAKRR